MVVVLWLLRAERLLCAAGLVLLSTAGFAALVLRWWPVWGFSQSEAVQLGLVGVLVAALFSIGSITQYAPTARPAIQRLPQAWSKLAALLGYSLASLLFLVLFFLAVYVSSESRVLARVVPELDWPVWLLQAVFALAFALNALRFSVYAADPAARPGSALPLGYVLTGVVVLVALGAVAVTGDAKLPPAQTLIHELWLLLNRPSLLAVPLFILSAGVALRSSIAARLLAWFNSVVAGVPAAPILLALLITSFAGVVSGSAAVALLICGPAIYPLIRASSPHESMVVGLVCSASLLAALLPASLPLVLFGIATHTEPARLLQSGALIAVVVLLVLVGVAGSRFRRRTVPVAFHHAPQPASALRRVSAALGWLVLTVIATLSGFFNVFELGALSLLTAILVVAGVHSELGARDAWAVLFAAGQRLGALVLLLAFVLTLNLLLVANELPQQLIGWVSAMFDTAAGWLLITVIVLFVLGLVLDVLLGTVILGPTLASAASVASDSQVGVVPLGLILVSALALGQLVSPLGMPVLTAAGVFRLEPRVVAKATRPFGLAGLGALLLIVQFAV